MAPVAVAGGKNEMVGALQHDQADDGRGAGAVKQSTL
jgi:hypothetical protein